jgi:hypothetical protein
MDSNASTRCGSARRISFMNAWTWPTMTKLFYRQPCFIKAEASVASGFSQKHLTRLRQSDTGLSKGAPGSIQPYSTSGVSVVMPSSTTILGLDAAAA